MLDLLIERYYVPEVLTAFSIENINSLTAKRKEDIKKYRKQYYQPIRFRYGNYFIPLTTNIRVAVKVESIYFYPTAVPKERDANRNWFNLNSTTRKFRFIILNLNSLNIFVLFWADSVLNVLKRWVDSYFHDFENNVELLNKMTDFLDSITEKSMKKWAVIVKKILQRKVRYLTFDSCVKKNNGNK